MQNTLNGDVIFLQIFALMPYICIYKPFYMQNFTDDILLFKLVKLQNDKKAYSKIYLHYYSALKAYASFYVSLYEAEDIVQDVLMNLWKKRHQIEISDSLSSYLFLSVRNKAINILKRNDAKENMMSGLKQSIIDESVDQSGHLLSELRKLINKSLSELPYEQRRAFEMSRFEGKTYREIAQEQNISIKTVEYRISQVLRKLETDLVDYLPIFTTLFAFLFSQPR